MSAFDLTPYLERIYGYAVRRSYSREEAEELSQNIVLEALRSMSGLRDPERFEPWLWGLAANVTRTFRRRQHRERAMYVWDAYEDVLADTALPETEDVEAEYARLREKIAGLSRIYREIILLHYYEGLPTRAIAERLSLPEGTVTWRLAAARRKLKEEYVSMNESALHPVKFKVDIYGTGNYDPARGIPFPSDYISDALSLNLLWHAYESPKTVEQLSVICGVPAYYIEDRLANLVQRGAMIERQTGKYSTNFFIRTDKYPRYTVEQAPIVLAPVMEGLIAAVEQLAAALPSIGFHRGDRTDDELRILAGVLAFDGIERKYSRLPYPPIAPNYDGYAWNYIGIAENSRVRHIGIGSQISANRGSRGSYMHSVFYFAGVGYSPMMYDAEINVCEDILTCGTTCDPDNLVRPMERGYIRRRDDGSLTVASPAFTLAQYAAFGEIAERCFASVRDEYLDCVGRFVAGFVALYPARFADEARRTARGFTRGLFDAVVRYAIESGRWPRLPAQSICDVLVQWRSEEDGKAAEG